MKFQPNLNIKHEPEETIIDVTDVNYQIEQELESYEISKTDAEENEQNSSPKKRAYNQSKLIACDQCERKYSSAASLKNHTRDAHPKIKSRKHCRLCDRTVKNLVAHKKYVHSGEILSFKIL